VTDFYVLTGDINRDRSVNGSDFAILAGNFGKSGMTYEQGDLNGDGSVNGSDFALLAGNFGKTLPAPAPAAATPAGRVAVATPAPASTERAPQPKKAAPVQHRPAPRRVRRVVTKIA
jgi:hypothetical protein